MMTQGPLPFQYKSEKNDSSLTSFAGLPLYIELLLATSLPAVIAESLNTKTQGWTDLQIIVSLVLLNIVGGDCVNDIDVLEQDAGLRTLLLKMQTYGMSRQQRRAYERRWRKNKCRALPSASAIHRYLKQFHNTNEEAKRTEGVAFIPEANALLKKLAALNDAFIQFAFKKSLRQVLH